MRQSQADWNMYLDMFGARRKSRQESIMHLMNSHLAKYTQAENAVDKYRRQKGLTRGEPKWPYLLYDTLRAE